MALCWLATPRRIPNPKRFTSYSQNLSVNSEKITVANGFGAKPDAKVGTNGLCGHQRARLDRAEPLGPAPEVQN